MALIRWEPARELRSPRGDFDRLFDTIFDTSTVASGRSLARPFVPALDVVDAQGEFRISLDLPGLSESEVSLEMVDGVLTVTGERRVRAEDGARMLRAERTGGRFRRSLTLPDGVDADAITARFEHGVLEIRVPKPAARQPRRITIAGSGSDAAIEAPESASASDAPAN